MTVVSREHAEGSLHGRVPALISSGELEAAAGLPLTAENSHVMLCGNPEMVKDTQNLLKTGREMRKHLRRKPAISPASNTGDTLTAGSPAVSASVAVDFIHRLCALPEAVALIKTFKHTAVEHHYHHDKIGRKRPSPHCQKSPARLQSGVVSAHAITSINAQPPRLLRSCRRLVKSRRRDTSPSAPAP